MFIKSKLIRNYLINWLLKGGMGGLDYGLNDYHCQVKLKKYKTSENEQSHGSFFLRVGGLGKKVNYLP